MIATMLSRILVVAASALPALAGCGDSHKGTPVGSSSATTVTTSANAGGIDPMTDAGTDPVKAAAGGSETALLERITIGRHEGYDRVVFQFRNDTPGYRVAYADPPFSEDGSGRRVDVDGSAFVDVRMQGAAGYDVTTGSGQLVYKGPRRISGSDVGTSVVRELVRTGDFEGVLDWVVGLDGKVDFRVRTLSDPPRLVVDFRNH